LTALDAGNKKKSEAEEAARAAEKLADAAEAN